MTFTVTVGMVALTLVLLGASFFSLTYSYIMTEKRSELKDRAERARLRFDLSYRFAPRRRGGILFV